MIGRTTHELRLAVRALRRAPLLASLAIAALGLGIGGTVTVFSAVNAAFLRALPYPDADRVAALWQTSPRNQEIAVPYQVVGDWAAGLGEAEHVAGYMGPGDVNVTADRGGAAARVASATRVTRAFFDVLGVRPVVGRAFTAEDSRPGASPVAVISHDLWQQLFGGDTAVLTRSLAVEGTHVPIVGVLPPAVAFPEGSDIWTSLDTQGAALGDRTAHNLRVIARARPGVHAAALQQSLTRVQERLEQTYPEMREGLGVRAVPLRTQLLGASADVIWMLFASVALVLIIACANVANLLLARASGRQTESALRRALGADRVALATPVVAEGLDIAGAGAAVGVAMAFWGQALLQAVLPPSLVDTDSLRIDRAVLLFAVVTATLAGLMCSMLPAVQASRADLRDVLTAGARTLAGGPQRTMRLVIGVEVALACTLLASSALFARSLAHLENVDTGFDPTGVAYATFAIGGTPGSVYQESGERVRFYRMLLERVQAMAGVHAAGYTTSLPFAFSPNGGIQVEGTPADRQVAAHFRLTGGRYFETLGIPLRSGRYLDEGDTAGRPLVAMVNEQAVRSVFGGGSPLGTRIRMPGMDGEPSWYTVVGVVGDIRHRGLTREPVAEAYFPFEQRPQRTWSLQLVARITGPHAPMARAIGEEVTAIDSRIPVSVLPLAVLVDQQVAPARLRAALVSGFGATSMVLSMIGIFGVMSYFVTRRTREVGVRIALGANRRQVQRLVIGRALAPVAAGVAFGLTLILAAGRLAESLLPGISPRDPMALGVAAGAIALAAAAAAWWPAWRASRLDPMSALRQD
jgi:predicted permease